MESQVNDGGCRQERSQRKPKGELASSYVGWSSEDWHVKELPGGMTQRGGGAASASKAKFGKTSPYAPLTSVTMHNFDRSDTYELYGRPFRPLLP